MKNAYILGLTLILLLGLAGCININKINTNFRRIDEAWLLDYQKTEDEYRCRIVAADKIETAKALRAAFIALNMPVKEDNLDNGSITSVVEAPRPLTKDEWKSVAEVETPRMKSIAGWMFTLPDNPKGYFITIRANFQEIKEVGTIVLLNYRLDNPEYRKLGIEPSECAPPDAVRLGSLKFWRTLDDILQKNGASKVRQRLPSEEKRKLAF